MTLQMLLLSMCLEPSVHARTNMSHKKDSDKTVLKRATRRAEVQELGSMNRETRRMASEDLAAMEQNSRRAIFHQNQRFHEAIQKHQPEAWNFGLRSSTANRPWK